MISYDQAIENAQALIGGQLERNSKNNKDVKKGYTLSNVDRIKMQQELNSAMMQNAWQQEFFDRNESIPAQVRQAREAGLNPALMYGGSSPSVSSSGSGAGMDTSGIGSGIEDRGTDASIAMQVISAILGFGSQATGIADTVSTVKNRSADTRLKETQARNVELDNFAKDLENKYKEQGLLLDLAKKRVDIDKASSEIEKNKAAVSEAFSRIDLNKSEIEVNGKKCQLYLSEMDKNAAEAFCAEMQANFHKVNANVIETMLPYQIQLQQADIALKNAQTDTQRAYAEQAYAAAVKSYLESAAESQLISSGYYEKQSALIDQNIAESQQRVKNMKTERVWANINGVVNTIGSVVSIAGDVVDLAYKPVNNMLDVAGKAVGLGSKMPAPSATYGGLAGFLPK